MPHQQASANVIWCSLAAQALFGAAILVLPFGFDIPSSWGLDFGHLLLFASAYVLAVICGIAASIHSRRWFLATAQMLIPPLLIVVVLANA